MTVHERMAELCKLLGMPPRVTSFHVHFDFSEGIVHCECEHLITDEGKILTDKEGNLRRIFSEGEIVWSSNTPT